MNRELGEICSAPAPAPEVAHVASAPPIYPAAVYQCHDTATANALLSGQGEGYVYQRDGHPNADMLAEKCRQMHAAERAAVMSSGMAAMATALLAVAGQGDHVVISNRLYGKTTALMGAEAARLGIDSSVADPLDVQRFAAALRADTRLVVVETISNPCLRISDIGSIADAVHQVGALLLVDNTFASPAICRPLTLGADFVLESMSKIMNGHGDVMMGLLCGRAGIWDRIAPVMSAWGLSSSPMDCWLTLRGLSTLHLRARQASDTALEVARFLDQRGEVERVTYPGLTTHPEHALANRQFAAGAEPPRYGAMITFDLRGGGAAVDRFIAGAQEIPFFPSLGDAATSVSHPVSTSHRLADEQVRQALGIGPGTLRLSIGLESPAAVVARLEKALVGLDD